MTPDLTTSQLKQGCRLQFLTPGALIQGHLHNSAWLHLYTSLIEQTEMCFLEGAELSVSSPDNSSVSQLIRSKFNFIYSPKGDWVFVSMKCNIKTNMKSH